MRLDKKTRDMLIRMIDSNIEDIHMVRAAVDKKGLDVMDKSTMMMKNAISKCDFYIYGGKMHFFNGMYYEGLEHDEYEYILDEVMDKRGVPASEVFRNGIYKACWRKVIGNNVDRANRSLVCFSNGVVNFEEEIPILKPHNPRFPVFFQLPYPYNERATCPLWEKFLSEVLPDESLRKNLQEFLGLIFVNRSQANVETMMWLHGNGANGKSVIFNTIMGVLGRRNVTNFDILDLTSGAQKERNIANINGKLLNYCSDVDSKTIMNDSIKALISGEPMTGRPLYKEAFTVYDIPLLMGNTNRVPYFKENSDAWLRRIRPIPFEVTIAENRQDKTLTDKLSKEYSGILNWILLGRMRIMRQKFHFTKSAKIDAFLRSYKNMGNNVKQFEDYLGISPSPKNPFDSGRTVAIETLYYKYLTWAEMVKSRIGEQKMTSQGFVRSFGELGYLKQKGPYGWVFRYFGKKAIDEFEIEEDNV